MVRNWIGGRDALIIERRVRSVLLSIRIGRVSGRERWDSSDVIAFPCRRIISRLRSLCHNAAFDALSILEPLVVSGGETSLLCTDGVISLTLASCLKIDLICGLLICAMFLLCDNLGVHDWWNERHGDVNNINSNAAWCSFN